MKIKKEHYKALRRGIFTFVNHIGASRLEQHYDALRMDERVKDINVRFMFDVNYAAGNTKLVCNYYTYLNDTHIKTALLKIQKELDLIF